MEELGDEKDGENMWEMRFPSAASGLRDGPASAWTEAAAGVLETGGSADPVSKTLLPLPLPLALMKEFCMAPKLPGTLGVIGEVRPKSDLDTSSCPLFF